MFLLKNGEHFGEEELISEEKRKYTVECLTQQGELFFMNKKVLQISKKLIFFCLSLFKIIFQEFFRRIMAIDSSKDFLLKNNKLKEDWNQIRIKMLSFQLSKKSIAEEPSIIDEPDLEFSLEKPLKIANESINNFHNFKTQGSSASNFHRFASTNRKLQKVFSNKNNLFLENMKGKRKMISKTITNLLNKQEQYSLNKKTLSPAVHLKIVPDKEYITNSEKKPAFKTQNLKKKIAEKIKEKHSKIVGLGTFEICDKNKNLLKNMTSNQKKIEISDFIAHNRQQSFKQTSDREGSMKKIQKAINLELGPLKYISDKLREIKNMTPFKKIKAFSFHSAYKSAINFSSYKI